MNTRLRRALTSALQATDCDRTLVPLEIPSWAAVELRRWLGQQETTLGRVRASEDARRSATLRSAVGRGEATPADRPTRKIASRSPKRQAQEREYARLRADYLAYHDTCGACHGRAASEVHHKRGRVGRLLTDPAHFLALCSPCHRYITDHPEIALAHGWSESRLAKRDSA